jgi:tRNA (cmo5U34)-methyltransferase
MEKPFSFATIKDFDTHISLSIPGYEDLVRHILNLSTYFIKPDSGVYDYGASTGKLIDELYKRRRHFSTSYWGIDKEYNLAGGTDRVIISDFFDYDPQFKSSLSLSIFTLQFLPVDKRAELLDRIYDNLLPGGALIVAEKTYIDDGYLNDAFTFSYYDFKLDSFTEKEILDKARDLRDIMRPLTEPENYRLFENAGFRKVQPFWQSLNFKAWVLLKDH